ncbi:MAG: hypothetical protein KBD56_09090 [Candidatus Eisenbacteria bacterium]|nr:hypothetical protein [Candidatus Eisenbacteria bacterium]
MRVTESGATTGSHDDETQRSVTAITHVPALTLCMMRTGSRSTSLEE